MSFRSNASPVGGPVADALFRVGRSIALAAALCVAGCAVVDGPRCAPGEQPAIDDVLYFGLQRPGGRVSDDEWRAFLRDVVTPRFPAGLSTWPVAGQWRTDDGTIVHEDSVALALVHPDDAGTDASIRFVAADYKRLFAQQAVLRVRSRACMSL